MVTSELNKGRVKVHLGSPDREPVYYRIGLTDAPEAFDGFGTLTIGHIDEKLGRDRYEPCRFVLINEKHFDWQEMRYRSGLHVLATHAHNMFDVYLPDSDDATALLWQALEHGLREKVTK
jgi:hypothetical protein